ncbi:sigma factor [Virgibacillus kekensis]|uniref:Sigma factor n=1 Tax=Virgibacillus kekensis TaxID=202261 RepID=A0ABV9DFN1_9BACI
MKEFWGGAATFMEVVEQNEKRIYFFIHKMGIKDQYGDYYQEGLFALWSAYKTFDPAKGEFSTYLNHQIRYRLADLKRTTHQRFTRDKFLSEALKWNMPTSITETPNDPFLWERVQSQMTVNQWKWVYYNIILDKSLKSIAEQENMTVDAVKSWGRQSIRKLRKDPVLIED